MKVRNVNGIPIGGRGYLVYIRDTSRKDEGEVTIYRDMQRQNLSHAPREHGWLGTTDNIYREARGTAVVTRILKDDDYAIARKEG